MRCPCRCCRCEYSVQCSTHVVRGLIHPYTTATCPSCNYHLTFVQVHRCKHKRTSTNERARSTGVRFSRRCRRRQRCRITRSSSVGVDFSAGALASPRPRSSHFLQLQLWIGGLGVSAGALASIDYPAPTGAVFELQLWSLWRRFVFLQFLQPTVITRSAVVAIFVRGSTDGARSSNGGYYCSNRGH